MSRKHGRHIRHLKRHRNVLYGIVVVLLALQIVSFISISSQISKVNAQQGVIKSDIDDYVDDLELQIGGVRQDSQFSISELTREVLNQRENIQTEIALIKSSQDDFSGIVEEVIEGVVNIRTDLSTGTGFFVNPEGYLVTNFHVIQGSSVVQVQTFDGSIHSAEIVGADAFTDLALLKIDSLFENLELADSDDIQVGEKVIAIGNPLGLSFTVTEGIVSATDRLGPNGLPSYVQTDVTLNPGNSGGPLINKEGEVIGINNFKIEGTESLGFALESNVVEEIVSSILEATITE